MGNTRSTASSTSEGFMSLAQLAVFEMPDRNIELNNINENNVQSEGSSIQGSSEGSYTTGTTGTTGTSSNLSSQSGDSRNSFTDDSIERGSVSDAGSTTNLETVNSSARSDFVADMNRIRSVNRTKMLLLISQAIVTLGFLFLLYQRLESIHKYSWFVILTPLALSFLIKMANKFVEFCSLAYVASLYRGHAAIPQRNILCFTLPLDIVQNGTSIFLEFVDNLGDACLIVAIALYLEGSISFPLIVVFTPLWCELFLGTSIRCLGCQSGETGFRAYFVGFIKGVGYATYKGLPAGMQPIIHSQH